jgi:hypothetical protein
MTTNIHSNDNFRNVGMLEIANEPVQDSTQVGDLLSSYYPNAFSVCPVEQFIQNWPSLTYIGEYRESVPPKALSASQQTTNYTLK